MRCKSTSDRKSRRLERLLELDVLDPVVGHVFADGLELAEPHIDDRAHVLTEQPSSTEAFD